MTTNAEAIKRVFDCLEKGKELKKKGLTEVEIRREVKDFHKARWIKSYTTRNDDLSVVWARLFN
jgi:orotate phosphoribosyltransferase-like protein